MKRSCATCLWWPDADDEYECYRVCRNYDAIGSDPNDPDHYWCSKWEPRDRSIIRCETCEWCDHGVCVLEPPSQGGYPAIALARCSHWRLREERDDG